jgi:long-chain fatty acid transport protein
VPNFHYVLPFKHRWAFGFGVTTPFGLATKYPDTSPSNILATKTELATVNFNPSIAYEINRYLSLGLGFDALTGEAIYNTNPIPPDLISCKLTGWGYGYNAGLLVQFTPTTRVGLSYRSAITVPAKGTSSSTSLFTGLPVTASTNANFPFPATTTFSVTHDVSSRFTVMGSAFYTQWSVFKELVINNIQAPTGTGTIAINQNYRDTWNFAVGGKYEVVRNIWLNAGFGHDQTPTRLGYRDIRLPDNNRYAGSLGLDIKPSDRFMWSMGWTHFFLPSSTPIDDSLSNDASKTTPTFAPGVSVGTEKGEINVVGIQLIFNID